MAKSKLDSARSFMDDMNKLAEELYSVRQSLNTREEEFKKKTDDLYTKEAELKAILLEQLKAVGLKSVKVASGDSWFISNRPSVEILKESEFTAWAIEQNLVKPDSERIKQKLKDIVAHGGELPSSVRLVDRDSISIRKVKEEKSQ